MGRSIEVGNDDMEASEAIRPARRDEHRVLRLRAYLRRALTTSVLAGVGLAYGVLVVDITEDGGMMRYPESVSPPDSPTELAHRYDCHDARQGVIPGHAVITDREGDTRYVGKRMTSRAL